MISDVNFEISRFIASRNFGDEQRNNSTSSQKSSNTFKTIPSFMLELKALICHAFLSLSSSSDLRVEFQPVQDLSLSRRWLRSSGLWHWSLHGRFIISLIWLINFNLLVDSIFGFIMKKTWKLNVMLLGLARVIRGLINLKVYGSGGWQL
jgi:hypothetical protein